MVMVMVMMMAMAIVIATWGGPPAVMYQVGGRGECLVVLLQLQDDPNVH